MKRGWMRFWLSVSFLILCFGSVAGQDNEKAPGKIASGARQNELTLAAIRPGRDSIASVLRRYRMKPADGNGATLSWHDECVNYDLYIDPDQANKAQSVRISVEAESSATECERSKNFKPWWVTGKHLALEDLASRVGEIYGQPTSRSPSTRDGQQLELLYYAFDWAGPDVPQVMEVLCTAEKDGKPGRVVEITLAAPSL